MSMRIWTRSLRTIRPLVNHPAQPRHINTRWAAVRPLSTTMASRHKETADHSVIDKHVGESVKNQKEGKGKWVPELASESEEDILADRLTDAEALEQIAEQEKERIEAVKAEIKRKAAGKD